MKYTVAYLSEAENDIRNAKRWYKKQKVGLERKFALELKQTIRYIIDNPLLFEVKYKNEADLIVYAVNEKYLADKVVYFTEYESKIKY
jgi:plasmid stabilization system protein ParE